MSKIKIYQETIVLKTIEIEKWFRGIAGTQVSRVIALSNAISRWLLDIMRSLTTVTRVIVKGTTPPTHLPSFEMIRARLLGKTG